MFEWKVEDMKLLQLNNKYKINENKIYEYDATVSKEDKIAFVDSMTNGGLTFILNLAEKFEKEKDSLPKDKWGEVQTVSLKAWIKRNTSDNDPIKIDTEYSTYIGRFSIAGCIRKINNINASYTWQKYNDLVDEVFSRQLTECARKEQAYFVAHDEYSILKRKLMDKLDKYHTAFGLTIRFSSGYSKVSIVADDGIHDREITIDEIKILLEKYDELQKTIDKITAEMHIKY